MIQLAASVRNECHYCVAAHSGVVRSLKLPESEITAIRHGELPKDPRNAQLVSATWQLIESSGNLSEAAVDKLEQAGLPREDLYEVIGNISLMTLTNMIANVDHTQLDDAFAEEQVA